jgi:hypothetical protein
MCAYGTCDDGLSGTGSCACHAGWEGILCDTAEVGVLVAMDVDLQTLEDTAVVVTLAATRSGGALTPNELEGRIDSLPTQGSLHQWHPILPLGPVITTIPATVSDAELRLVYVPPANANSGS